MEEINNQDREFLPQDHDIVVEEEGSNHYNHIPVRGTKPLTEVYENIALLKPTSFVEATKQGG